MCCSWHVDPQRNADGDELLARLQQMSLPCFLFFSADDLSEQRSASLCQVLLQIETELICSGSVFGGGRLELVYCFLQAPKN